MPTVSIIIPVYKAEHYLDACMCSVVGQSCTDLEILLVALAGGKWLTGLDKGFGT